MPDKDMPDKDMGELMEALASRLSVAGCRRCGHIARVGNEAFCPICRKTGYLIRMMTAAELTAAAAWNAIEGADRYRVAKKQNECAAAVLCWTDKDD